MGAILMLVVSILYPILLYQTLRIIYNQIRLRLYWMIVPLVLVISISIPYLYSYIRDPDILFALEAMIDYSVKTGLMIFLVIPSFVTGILCTLYGYMGISKWSVPVMSAVMILGVAGLLFSNPIVNRLIYEPAIHWEQLTAADIAGAGMWIYSEAAEGGNRYMELDGQEAGQVCSILNQVPKSVVRAVNNDEHPLLADISLSLQRDHNRSIHVQYYTDRNLYIEITHQRSRKVYLIESAELENIFIHKLKSPAGVFPAGDFLLLAYPNQTTFERVDYYEGVVGWTVRTACRKSGQGEGTLFQERRDRDGFQCIDWPFYREQRFSRAKCSIIYCINLEY